MRAESEGDISDFFIAYTRSNSVRYKTEIKGNGLHFTHGEVFATLYILCGSPFSRSEQAREGKERETAKKKLKEENREAIPAFCRNKFPKACIYIYIHMYVCVCRFLVLSINPRLDRVMLGRR